MNLENEDSFKLEAPFQKERKKKKIPRFKVIDALNEYLSISPPV